MSGVTSCGENGKENKDNGRKLYTFWNWNDRSCCCCDFIVALLILYMQTSMSEKKRGKHYQWGIRITMNYQKQKCWIKISFDSVQTEAPAIDESSNGQTVEPYYCENTEVENTSENVMSTSDSTGCDDSWG